MARSTGPPQSISQKTSANVITLTSSTTAAVARSCGPVIWLPPPASEPSTSPTASEVRDRQHAEQDHRRLAPVLGCSRPSRPSPSEKTIASTAAGSASTTQIHQSFAE